MPFFNVILATLDHSFDDFGQSLYGPAQASIPSSGNPVPQIPRSLKSAFKVGMNDLEAVANSYDFPVVANAEKRVRGNLDGQLRHVFVEISVVTRSPLLGKPGRM